MKAGWATVELGEVAELSGRIGWKGLTAKEYTTEGPLFLSVHALNYGDYVDFRDANHISSARYIESPEIMLMPDDILICKDGAGIGKVGIIGCLPSEATINSSLLLIRAGGRVVPKFLYRCLESPYFQAIVQSKLEGATTPHLYQREIKKFPIPLPPLDEQKRIVAVLDEAFEGLSRARANAGANLADARALWESSLDETFVELSKCADLVDLPSVVTADCTLSYGIVQPGDETDSGLPIVRPVDLSGDVVTLSGLKRIDPKQAQGYKRTELQGGELLLCVRGTTGTVSIADKVLSGANVTRGIVPIRFRADRINPRFAFFQFISPIVQKQIRAKTYGAALMQINIGDLRKLTLLLPNLAKQDTVCEKLEGIRASYADLSKRQAGKIADLDNLRQSLLQKAFSGELT